MVLREGVAGEQVKPVGVHGLHALHFLLKLFLGIGSVVEILQGVFIAHHGHVDGINVVHTHEVLREGDALFGVHEVHPPIGVVRAAAESASGRVRDHGAPHAPLLRRDDDDAIRRARAIEGCGGGIFQHVKTIDILRVESRDGVADAVYIVRVVEHIR